MRQLRIRSARRAKDGNNNYRSERFEMRSSKKFIEQLEAITGTYINSTKADVLHELVAEKFEQLRLG